MVTRSAGKVILASAVMCVAVIAEAKEGESATGFKPAITVREKYSDNIYLTPRNETDSWITTVKPQGELIMKSGVQKLTLGADTEAGYYTTDSRNDYVDWSGHAKAEVEITPRNHVDALARYSHKHERIGEGASELRSKINLQKEPDEFNQTDGDLKYTFGAKGARSKLVLRDIYMEKEYSNHRDLNRNLDRRDNEFRETGSLKITPKTSVLLEGRQKSINYVEGSQANAIRDSDEARVYIGAEWEKVANTTGAVRVGRMNKDFRNQKTPTVSTGNARADAQVNQQLRNREDHFSAPSWEATTTWKPLSYSSLTLDMNRQYKESETTFAFIDTTTTRITWNHDWSSVLRSKVYAGRTSDNYEGTDRAEDIKSWGVGMIYDLNNWASVFTEYTRDDKDSNLANTDYVENVIMVGAKFSMK